jgi:hypothetical protein
VNRQLKPLSTPPNQYQQFVITLTHISVLSNPSTPNDLQRRGAVSPLKIKIPGKNMRQKPTNTPIIHSVY